jgi:hypothetical protein
VINRRRLLTRGVVLICWVFSVCLLLIFSANNRFDTLNKQVESHNFTLTLPKNQLDAFSYTRFAPEGSYRPIYAIAFEKLLLENNSFGPFKTAMHKKAIIRDLELRFYHYIPADADGNTAAPNVPWAPDTAILDAKGLIREIADKFTDTAEIRHIANLNFTNVSEVRVNNFDCRFLYEDAPVLSVHCRRATASYRDSDIELHGHVIIKTRDGATLESNYVKWDVRNKIFKVNSLYAMNRNGAVKTGRNACFDFTLNEVGQAKNCVKEEHKCIAGL